MSAKRLRTAYGFGKMIPVQPTTLHGPWPPGMTLFILTTFMNGPRVSADQARRRTISIAPVCLI